MYGRGASAARVGLKVRRAHRAPEIRADEWHQSKRLAQLAKQRGPQPGEAVPDFASERVNRREHRQSQAVEKKNIGKTADQVFDLTRPRPTATPERIDILHEPLVLLRRRPEDVVIQQVTQHVLPCSEIGHLRRLDLATDVSVPR